MEMPRSMLESCGLATWLLDPNIDANARVSRVLAIRYQSVEEQLKFSRASNHPENAINYLKARLNSIALDATSLGFQSLLDRKGRHRIGVAERMPSATELIKRTLDEETMYRMLSAIAMGITGRFSSCATWQAMQTTNKSAQRKQKRFEKRSALIGWLFLGRVQFGPSFAHCGISAGTSDGTN